MHDTALGLKIGFGAIVLAFSGVSLLLRKPPALPPRAGVQVMAPAAPLDVAEDGPVRIEAALETPKRAPRILKAAPKRLKPRELP